MVRQAPSYPFLAFFAAPDDDDEDDDPWPKSCPERCSTYALFVSATIIFLTYARTVGILELFLPTHADLRADIIFNACESI